jgi:hypothetical protein
MTTAETNNPDLAPAEFFWEADALRGLTPDSRKHSPGATTNECAGWR